MEQIIVKKKKQGQTEIFNSLKIHSAIRKSADRILVNLSDEDCKKVSDLVLSKIDTPEIAVRKLHNIVEVSLSEAGFETVADSYRRYRNYKIDAQKILEAVDAKVLELGFKLDKSNANCNSALVSTKRCLIYGEQQKERYKRHFLTAEELQDVIDGFYYVHDLTNRLDCPNNCELANYGEIMKDGFVMADIEYTEPKSVAAAISVLSDLISTISGQSYGGNTAPTVDTILSPYCEKSYQFYLKQYEEIVTEGGGTVDKEKQDKYAVERVTRELMQGLQAVEFTLNSVESSRGDYAFVTFTFGHDTSRWGTLVSKCILDTRRKGQGAEGRKVPVLFPKLVFIYDSELHGPGKELEWLFKEAVECTKVAQYPNYLSLDLPAEGDSPNYVGEIYHKWGKIVSPMGCRSFLGPFFKKSWSHIPKDETDELLIYRPNMGVITMNLPMLYRKSVEEHRDWFEVIDDYMEKIRRIHKRTFDYVSKMKASCNPAAFMHGGFDGGHLKADQQIKRVMRAGSLSFGYIGLNEVNLLATGCANHENPDFAIKTLEYISNKANEFKELDKLGFGVYGTPAESLVTIANDKFVDMYGEVPGVIEKGGYLSNSFHTRVTADVTPIEKMDLEAKFWNFSNGGKICHIQLPDVTNTEGIISLIRYGMSKGLYLSPNHKENHCCSCGEHWVGDDTLDVENCPKCNSGDIVKVRVMNGYLSFTRTRSGDSRYYEGKLKEIRERKNM